MPGCIQTLDNAAVFAKHPGAVVSGKAAVLIYGNAALSSRERQRAAGSVIGGGKSVQHDGIHALGIGAYSQSHLQSGAVASNAYIGAAAGVLRLILLHQLRVGQIAAGCSYGV